MEVDKQILESLSILASSVTPGAWVFVEGEIMSGGGNIVARIGPDSESLSQQQVADGEFIASLRNTAPYLLSTIRDLREVNGRLITRVSRLESELYGERFGMHSTSTLPRN